MDCFSGGNVSLYQVNATIKNERYMPPPHNTAVITPSRHRSPMCGNGHNPSRLPTSAKPAMKPKSGNRPPMIRSLLLNEGHVVAAHRDIRQLKRTPTMPTMTPVSQAMSCPSVRIGSGEVANRPFPILLLDYRRLKGGAPTWSDELALELGGVLAAHFLCGNYSSLVALDLFRDLFRSRVILSLAVQEFAENVVGGRAGLAQDCVVDRLPLGRFDERCARRRRWPFRCRRCRWRGGALTAQTGKNDRTAKQRRK